MHQYTADPANHMAAAGHDVHLVTTTHARRDRYAPAVTIHMPVETTNTGFSRESLRLSALGDLRSAICDLRPDVVHLSGPHLWNVPLVHLLKGKGIPVVHTIHDLDPHSGAGYGVLLRPWNWLIARSADHILVHGQVYRRRLIEGGMPDHKVTCTPLLHLFLGSAQLDAVSELAASATYEPWALFFGRVERYKGIEHLVTACDMLDGAEASFPRVVIAGRGDLSAFWSGPLPEGLEVRNHLIDDEEALDLFCRCGVLVLPYIDATQSALVAAAYYFGKPVIVTRTGALPEYVQQGHTGCVVEPGQAFALARCLGELLGDAEQLTKMGAAGRAWYEEQRAKEQRTLLQMYDRVARQKPR
jgi:glycosyltransferase involved in cell wall biosynthesis